MAGTEISCDLELMAYSAGDWEYEVFKVACLKPAQGPSAVLPTWLEGDKVVYGFLLWAVNYPPPQKKGSYVSQAGLLVHYVAKNDLELLILRFLSLEY